MENYQLPLAATIKELKLFQPFVSYDVKVMQRSIYLLECVGYNLNYGFYWSFTSPYSEDLMDDFIDVRNCLDLVKDNALKKPCKKVCRLLLELEDKYKEYDMLKLEWLDKLVGIAYGLDDIDENAKREYEKFKKAAKKILKKTDDK